jgi:hypothetical protein
MQETNGITSIEVNEQVSLEIAHRQVITYLDYNNGKSAVGAYRLIARNALSHAGYSITFALEGLGVSFAEPFTVDVQDVSSTSGFETLRQWPLLPNPFLGLNETITGELNVAVSKDGLIEKVVKLHVDLAPMSVWKYQNIHSVDDLIGLASFSVPSNTAIPEILTKAREELKALGGFQSTAGYQHKLADGSQDVETIKLEVKALFNALRSLEIDYSNPPASYDEASQRIRTPKEVLSSKSATCLDTALLSASLLEAMGYRPLLAVIPNHAFVGLWLQDGYALKDLVAPVTESALLLEQQLLFFETTVVCKGKDHSFEDAVKLANSNINESLELKSAGNVERAQKYKLIDVSALKIMGMVKPIPDRVVDADGNVTVVESVFTPTFGNLIPEGQNESPALRQATDDSPARVKVWKESLLDLTFFNPLLEMTRGAGQIKKGGFKILPPSDGPGYIEDVLQSREASGRPKTLQLLPMPVKSDAEGNAFRTQESFRGDASDEGMQKFVDTQFNGFARLTTTIQPDAFSKRLKALARAARATIEETGVNSLYITFGSLTWERLAGKGSNGKGTATSPLLLLPVTITPLNRGQEFAISLDETNAIATNETLAIKLLNDFGIDLPKLRVPDEDSSGFDVPGLIAHVREVLGKSKYTSWRVDADCSIGFYDFSTYHQWKDLNDNWRTLSNSPLVEHLISKSHLEFEDPARSEDDEFDLDLEASKVPVETDESQIRAIARSLNGESFVIQGPPGTGKSQTITNLLARNLQEGRRVLFVCEKAAALEVVKSRLESVGLGDFVLDLHGSKTKPAEVRARLNIALEAAPDADDTGLETAKYDHDMALNGLLKYPGRLHNIDEEFGTSVYDARDRYLAIASEHDLALDRSLLRTMKLAEKQEFSHNLLQLKDEGDIAGNSRKNPWSLSGLLPEAITLELKDELRATLELLKREGEAVANATDAQSIINQVTSITDFDALTNLVSGDVMSGPQVELSLSPVTEAQIIRAQNAVNDINSQVAANAMTSEKMLDADVDRLRLVGFEASQANFLTRNKKLDAFAFALKPYVNPAFPITRENSSLALDTIAKFKDLAIKTVQAVRDVTVLAVPSSWNPLDAADRDWFLAEVSRIQALKTFLDSVSPNSKAAIQQLLTNGQASAIDSVSAFAKGAAKLFNLLAVDDESLELWLNGRSLLTALNESLPLWFSNANESDARDLTRWARVTQILKPLKDAGQLVAYKDILRGTLPFENVALAFERSYYKLVFDKLLDDNDLGNFEGPAFDRNIATFGEAAHKLRGFNRATMAQQIVDSRTFDGRAGVGKAGQLKSELQKRSNTLPVRQLMKRYWDTITEITPCIAASPDSVARFLDVNHAKFDLVVFDEASQIRVATAIGALGRAKSAIIVGDSKQMPPTSFFAAQYDGDEDMVDPEAELPTQDEESILSEAVRAQIPSTMLTWHYRSQDEALIAFSNKEYYEGKLSSFPSPTDALDSQGVKWVRLEDGFYIRGTKSADLKQTVAELKVDSKSKQKFGALAASDLFNTNPVEAMAVVSEIRRRLGDPELKRHSIGVVTMNENQKKLIDLLLDDVDDTSLQEARNSQTNADYIFVRALEKVQGDERDVILMSIGFSRDATGKVPLNFGPLSRIGGERRLNVAVTRARQQVVVFCSFEPEDLKLKETTARGMKDLQGYLSMAKLGPRAIGLGNGGKSRGFDRHRHDVAKALSERGYAVTEDLGLSGFRIDIAVSDPKDPAKKLMAIMLDGRAWSKRAIASDRDVLPILMLQERMGWPLIERVWLPTWMRDRDGELDRLVNSIKQAEFERANLKKVFNLTPHTPIKASVPEPVETLTGVIETPTIANAPGTRAKSQIGVNIDDIPEFAEFLIMPIGAKSDLNALEHPAVKKAIREFAEGLTELEGPVSPSRFASLVAKSFDMNGVKSEKASLIAKLPDKAVHKRDTEGFIFPNGVAPDEFTTWKRQESGEGRDLQDISLSELANAMRDLCARVHGMPQAELFRQVSLAFGRSRVGAVADARLSSALALGLELGFLREQDELIEAIAS